MTWLNEYEKEDFVGDDSLGDDGCDFGRIPGGVDGGVSDVKSECLRFAGLPGEGLCASSCGVGGAICCCFGQNTNVNNVA